MNIPEELKYSKTHEWVKMLDETTCEIGITDFAQSELGDLVFINLPKVGDKVKAGDIFCDVESVKAVSDVISPVSGTVFAVNETLIDAPQKLNEDPFGAWIARMEGISSTDELMDAAEYKTFCAAEEA